MSEFGSLLKRLRTERNISQSKLAERADFDHSYVSRLESGARTPTRDAVSRLSEALQLGADEYETLLRSAGFIGDDDSAIVKAIRADAEVAGLVDIFESTDLPEEFVISVRLIVRELIQQASIVREVAA